MRAEVEGSCWRVIRAGGQRRGSPKRGHLRWWLEGQSSEGKESPEVHQKGGE